MSYCFHLYGDVMDSATLMKLLTGHQHTEDARRGGCPTWQCPPRTPSRLRPYPRAAQQVHVSGPSYPSEILPHLGPNARLPVLALYVREATVNKIARRNGDQIGRNSDRLRVCNNQHAGLVTLAWRLTCS